MRHFIIENKLLTFENISLMVSLITGGIALFIAKQQMNINKYKLKNDLFERRIGIYEATYNILNALISEKNIDENVYNEYVKAKNLATFTFSKDVVDKLNEYFEITFLKWHFSDFEDGKIPHVFGEEIQAILNMNIGENFVNKSDLMSKIRIYSMKEFKQLNELFQPDMKIYKY
jgi:hypothetical protein